MWISNNSSFCHFWMSYESAFYFSGSKIMARHYDDIVYSPSYPIVAILISPTTITCGVFSKNIEVKKR
jgi:hypothetical protein